MMVENAWPLALCVAELTSAMEQLKAQEAVQDHLEDWLLQEVQEPLLQEDWHNSHQLKLLIRQT